MNRVAIYHFTDKSEKRPVVNEKQMQILREFAKQFGTIEKEYLDKSLNKCDQIEKEHLCQDIKDYDILVTKDFYHIAKGTGTCISMMQQFLNQGVETHSINDGCFTFSDAPFEEPLRVAIYHCKYIGLTSKGKVREKDNSLTIQTQLDIFNLFVNSKTHWKVIDIYVDQLLSQSEDEKVNLQRLIKNRERYDLLLCRDFNTVSTRTAKFCKRRNDMRLDIYSLREGYLKYTEEC